MLGAKHASNPECKNTTRLESKNKKILYLFILNCQVAQFRFVFAIKDIEQARAALDNASLALQAKSDAAFKSRPDMGAIGQAYRDHADAIVASWWNLHTQLVQTHGDGRPKGYPAWWLRSKDVGYTTGLRNSSGASGGGADADDGTGLPEAKQCVQSSCSPHGGMVDLQCVMRCLS